MKFVLDTNAVSALMKGDPAVVQQLKRIERGQVSIPQPVVAELAYGLARLPRSARKDRLRRRLSLILEEIDRATWHDDVSESFGAIKAMLERRGERIEDFDAAIAAHALALGAVLVTSNLGHMVRIDGLRVQDWRCT